jgi:hypothetical protein
MPKRSDQRRRVNKPVVPVTKAAAAPVVVPDPDDDWHPLAAEWYVAVSKSGQAQFYESGDYVTLKVAAGLLSSQLVREQPSAAVLKQWWAMSTSLLVTEGDRRRLRLELERGVKAGEVTGVSHLDELRRRVAGAG